MKKNKILLLISFLIFSSISYGSCNLHETYWKRPHRLFFGPEIFWFDIDTNVEVVHVNDTQFFFGLRFGYEHLKPCSLYFDIDFLAAFSAEAFQTSYDGYPYFRDSGGMNFINLGAKLGYTFSPNACLLLTPFLGIEGYGVKNGNHYFGFEQIAVGWSGGIRSEYAISPCFHSGLNVKALYFPNSFEKKFKRSWGLRHTTRETEWGGEIGIPFVWHVGVCRRWDIQLEPYYLRFGFSEDQNIYGIRLIFGYRL